MKSISRSQHSGGTGNSAGDNLPPYRFTNALADSYRITKVVTPTGGEMTIDYEEIPKPDTTWVKHINYDESFFDRSRRLKRRIWDADGAGSALPDTTTFNYIETASVMETDNANRLRRITFPLVDEVLPGGHGKIRRNFVGESDLDALGLSATNRKHESERNIRRGLLEAVTHHDDDGAVVQRERTDWQVTTQGTWTGEWQWYYHPGIPQQAYWLRAEETTTTKDGASTTTLTNHNARNGLVASQTLKSGSLTLRVTDTSYHADQVTSSPVALAFGQPVLDTTVSVGNRVHAAFLSSGDPPTASVEAFLNADSGIESTGVYDFEGRRFSVSGADVLRIRGSIGTDQLQGGDNMYASATVTVDWKDGGSYAAGSFMQNVPVGSGLPEPQEKIFDVLVPVPSGTDSAHVNLELHAAVYKEAQAVYRKIRVYAKDIEVTGMSADDPEDVFLERAHILNRPHVVTVKDGSGIRLQSTRYRYGRFNERGVRIVMPDTTSVWLDRDSDGQVDTGEWIDQLVATGYNIYGNLIESRDAHGTITSTIMGYGDLRSVATFTGAAAATTAAVVFDDQGSWTDLTALRTNPWSKTGTGTPVLDGGALTIDNAVARRDLPANTGGVFGIDVMVEAENEQTAVALANSSGAGTDRIRWVFDADGTFKALSGTTLTATGASYAANQWYHLKIQWNGQASKWWAHVDGVRYPASGEYALASSDISRVKLSNGASSPIASFDNLRAWPSDAQPAALRTYDPVTLDATALTDANGHTTRFLRDGLRRVVQTIDGAGRVTAQRDHDFSRTASSVYNVNHPNRQTDIAYPSRDGHKDLSADGHRDITRGTGDSIEEGVSLATADPYVVASGDAVHLRASVRVRLTTGFQANNGADFRAMLDPLAGGNRVTGTGDISYNVKTEGKRSVQLAPDARLETGRISGHVTARADFYPASTSSGKAVIMAFTDDDDHVRVVYENGSVTLESGMDGQTTSSAMVPGYTRSWPWARVEMELLPTGAVNAWVYGHNDTRFKGSDASVTVPANWTPLFTAEGGSGNGYIADLYIGAAEVVATSFDGLARNIQTRARAGASDIVTQTRYNRVGKPERLLGPSYLSPSYTYGALTNAAAGNRITQVSYDDDPLLRTSQVIPPGHTSSNAINTSYGFWSADQGLRHSFQTVVDEDSVATTYRFDPYGRIRYALADAGGTDQATRNNLTIYAHDALDRLTATTMPQGGSSSRSTYAYDTLGRLSIRHHPDADGATRYKYDDLGRVRFTQDARQKAAGTGNAIEKITFTVYDDFGRVTRVGEAAATFSSLDAESSYAFEAGSTSWRSRMTYDGDLVASGPNYAQGRLTKVEENTDADADAEVVHEYAYDHLGNVRVKRVEIEGLTGTRTVEYIHDLAGRVTRLIYPDGAQARYAYDGAGRLARVWDAQGNTLAAYTHTAAGNIGTHVVGDGIVTGTYAYNPREWATRIDYPGIFTVSQQYDAVGNVTAQNYRRAASESEKAAAYTYDNLHRLTGFDLDGGAHTRSYAYDRNGNITRVTTNGADTHYSYNSRTTPNRLDFVLGAGNSFQSYAYNENGWTTSVGDVSLTYDYRGLTTGVGTAAYTMDPDRRRVKKTVGTVTTFYLRGAGGTVLAEYTGQTLSARYVYAGSRRIARVAGGSQKYYLADHLGSTRSLLDETGTVTAAYDYWPYGNVLASSGTGSTHFRFTGHERDAESGLDYMLERSYGSEIGRFLRPDPMQGEYPGISPYTYANNNPLKYVDPDGRIVLPAVLGLLYAATEVASTGYDAYTLYETIQDPKSTKVDVGLAAVGLGLGTALPGSGSAYVNVLKQTLKKAGDFVKGLTKGGKGKGLTTPNSYFGSKTQEQAEQALKNKFGPPRNPRDHQKRGNKSFFNERTERSYNVHNEKGHGKPHVDIKRRGRSDKETRQIDLKQ